MGGYFYHYRILSQGFGLSELHYGCMLPETIMTLISARINGLEYSSMTNIHRWYSVIVYEVKLFPNYPNPFNSNISIKYQLKEAIEVKLEIYNLRGQHIRTLIDKFQISGSYLI